MPDHRRPVLAAVAVLLAAALSGCSGGASRVSGEGTPSQASAALSPSAPTTTPSPTASPTVSPTPPTLIAFAGCDNPRVVPGYGKAPYPKLSLRLKAPRSMRAGRHYTLLAEMANLSTTTRTFNLTGNPVQATLMDGAGHGSLLAWSDAVSVTQITLPSHTVKRIPVRLVTRSCGAGKSDPPLPVGTYKLGFAVNWLTGARSGTWGVKQLTVRVR
jgi:hypothetical protein